MIPEIALNPQTKSTGSFDSDFYLWLRDCFINCKLRNQLRPTQPNMPPFFLSLFTKSIFWFEFITSLSSSMNSFFSIYSRNFYILASSEYIPYSSTREVTLAHSWIEPTTSCLRLCDSHFPIVT